MHVADGPRRICRPSAEVCHVNRPAGDLVTEPNGAKDESLTTGLAPVMVLARAAAAARAAHVDFGRWLIERAGMSRAAAEYALGKYYGCPFFRFDEKTSMPEAVRGRLHLEFLTRICAVPVEQRVNGLVVVMEDPSNLTSIDELEGVVQEKLLLRVGIRDEILAFIDHAYGRVPDIKSIMLELGNSPEETLRDAEDEGMALEEADSAVIKLVNQLIVDAVERGASDIHVEPNGDDAPVTVRLRVDGDCAVYQEIPSRFRRALVARLKVMARLDITERRRPQDGKLRYMVGKRKIELRLASYPTAQGDEDVVMRIVPDGKPLPLEQMHFSPRNLAAMRGLIHHPYGLVLCVGPTGSGKTTTLHSALSEINNSDLKICTAEDPVEITQPGLRQLQVQPRIGLTFAVALRSFLRADPDVIMIGEMRDQETSQIAVEASLTGHLVLSTLHTNTAAETITRLVDMGLEPFSFADSLLGLIAQRLTAALCPHCRERCQAGSEEQRRLDQLLLANGSLPSQAPPWRARGCDRCGGKGYHGRLAVHEVLVVDDAIRQAIGRRARIDELRHLAVAGGMRTLLLDGLDKVQAGLTDLKQLLMVVNSGSTTWDDEPSVALTPVVDGKTKGRVP